LVYAFDGANLYNRLFLRLFSSEYKTCLVTFSPPTQVPDGVHTVLLQDFWKQLRIRRLDKFRIVLGTFWRILQLRRCLKSIGPCTVVGNYVTTYGLYASVCGFRPFILFGYGSDVSVDPQRSLLHRWITIRVIRSADLILIDSEVQKRDVMSLGGSPEKIVCFPWVDLSDLRNTDPDSTLRDGLGWSDKTVVVSVRKHEPNYAVDTLIRAIPSVLTQCPNVRFLIFGAGTQTAQLVRLAHRLNVEEFVHFAGLVPRDRLLRYVKSSDIYVSTSLSDGCSSSLLEAIYLGVPVVVTFIPGNAEWVSHGLNGLMFSVRDSEGLAKAIVRLATDHIEAERMSREAMDQVRARVKWEVSSKELIERMRVLEHKYRKDASG
jgi:glycosyltransferase involved in cell wall biosynthesis